MKKKLFRVIALAAGLMMLAACGGTPPPLNDSPSGAGASGAASGAAAAKAPEGQTLRSYLAEEPKTLDPSLSSDQVGGYVLWDTMDSLTRLESDGNGGYEYKPAGAKSWESNEDGTVWTFHLNDNKWSDGVAVTAGDYEYALKRTANPATGAPLVDMLFPILNYEGVTSGEMDPAELGVKALDDSTLEITLTEPMPFFLSLTYDRAFAPQRADLVEQYGEKYGSEAEYTVSNGPFKVESWVHNSTITLVKNEDYWDADSVKLDKLVYSIITDNTTRLNAFESGELDTILVSDLEWRDKFEQMEGVQYFATPTATLTYSFFNCEDPIFQNENIRKAFMLGIDREELNTLCFGSLRTPTYGWVAPSITVEDINYREAVGDTVKEIAAENEDPAALLLKGMQELGLGDDPTNLDITFSLAGTDDWFQTLGAYLQQAYKTSLGVDLEISFSEWGIFYDNVQKGNYQIGFMNWGAFYNEPYDVLSLFTTNSNAIMTNWSNAEFDALMDQVKVEMDPEKRVELYKQAERILLESAAASPLATGTEHRFYQPWVQNVNDSTFGSDRYKYVSIAQ